jgi:hypothetical protein
MITSKSQKITLELPAQEKVLLFQMTSHPAWQVLLKIMQVACINQDVVLVGTDNSESAKVLSEHAIAQAKWRFFEFVQREVEKAVAEAKGEEPVPEATDEDKLQETLNAVPRK